MRDNWTFDEGTVQTAHVPGGQPIERLFAINGGVFVDTRYGRYRLDMESGTVYRVWCGPLDWLRHMVRRVRDALS